MILSLFFRTEIRFTRAARLTIVFFVMLGELFMTGFFYDGESTEASNSNFKSWWEYVSEYTVKDFLVAFLADIMMLPFVVIVCKLLLGSRVRQVANQHSRRSTLIGRRTEYLKWRSAITVARSLATFSPGSGSCFASGLLPSTLSRLV